MIKITENNSKKIEAKGVLSIEDNVFTFVSIDKNGKEKIDNLSLDDIQAIFDNQEVKLMISTTKSKEIEN